MKKISENYSKFVLKVAVFFTVMLLPAAAYADDIASTKLATGIERLINDLTTWITGLAIPVTIVIVVYFFIRMSGADEQDKKMWQNRIKLAGICGVGAIVAAGLIKALASYFQ